MLDELKEICKEQLCRENTTVTLKKEDGSQYKNSFDQPLPIISNGWVSIFPGETLYIEGELGEGDSLKLKAVKEITHPEKTMTLTFGQMPDKVDMMFRIDNPFDRKIKFHTAMMLTDSDKMFKTSSCPVLPGLFSMEHWQQPIFQLFLFEFKFHEADNKMVCEF